MVVPLRPRAYGVATLTGGLATALGMAGKGKARRRLFRSGLHLCLALRIVICVGDTILNTFSIRIRFGEKKLGVYKEDETVKIR